MRATSRWLVKRTLPSLAKRRRIFMTRASCGDSRSQLDGLAGALAAARRRGGRGDDVLDRVAGAGAAVVAGRPPAVLEADLVEGVAPVLPEEVLVEAGGQVVPRERLVLGAVPVDDVLRAETGLG